MMPNDSRPSASRPRSYSGGYMEKGIKAEAIVLELLREMPGVLAVEDVRQNKEYQEKEIDYLVRTKDRIRSLEVKNDDSLGITGHFIFELMRINHTANDIHIFKLGWSARSEADTLAFYAPADSGVHIVRMVDFRDATREAIEQQRQNIKVIIIPTDEIKSTVAALIPEVFVKKQKSYRWFPIKDAK